LLAISQGRSIDGHWRAQCRTLVVFWVDVL
jgi:hypothetical protein